MPDAIVLLSGEVEVAAEARAGLGLEPGEGRVSFSMTWEEAEPVVAFPGASLEETRAGAV